MVANILQSEPPPPEPGGQKVKIKLFQNTVMLQIKIKENQKCSNMVATILPTYLPLDLGLGQKVKSHFSEHGHVAYQIKGN